ncbi:hypothetical protein VDGL01_03902 [Verticillium dahliae]
MPDMTGTDLHCQYRGLFASIGERRGSAQTMVTSGLAGGMWATGSQSKVPDVLLQRTGPRLNSKSHRWCDGQAGKLASWVGDWSVPMRLAATTCTSQPSGRSKYRKAMEEGLEGKGQWACGSTTEGRAAIHCAIATLAGKEVPVRCACLLAPSHTHNHDAPPVLAVVSSVLSSLLALFFPLPVCWSIVLAPSGSSRSPPPSATLLWAATSCCLSLRPYPTSLVTGTSGPAEQVRTTSPLGRASIIVNKRRNRPGERSICKHGRGGGLAQVLHWLSFGMPLSIIHALLVRRPAPSPPPPIRGNSSELLSSSFPSLDRRHNDLPSCKIAR